MITIEPIPCALVPADSAAADALGAPNYDEFQSDLEIWQLLQAKPDCLLCVTMAHCDAPSPERIGEPDSEASLERAAANMERLIGDARTRELRDILWVCEITSPKRPGSRQIGLGGLARTGEIRTETNPAGSIIRNEGVREAKARGRARLVQRIAAFVDCVNHAVDDASGAFRAALETHADAFPPAFATLDEAGNLHRVWLVTDTPDGAAFRAMLAREPHAYVADGNHRSAAAALLGHEHFPAVFFPASTLHIAPYNRLIANPDGAPAAGLGLERSFRVDRWPGSGAFQPAVTHDIGLYDGGGWWRLRPRPGAFDAADAAQDIDADIVQRRLFGEILGIGDARDPRLTFVGANRDAAWLQARVDDGAFRYAVTLPAVTMQQFVRVCLQGALMPPKSTWFEPKLRSGLVMALLGRGRSGGR
jgi:uncharacterized protein (DUF1015 family)